MWEILKRKNLPILAYLVVVMFIALPNVALSADKRWLYRVGMGLDYLNHSGNATMIHGARTFVLADIGYIRNRLKLELNATSGFAPVDFRGDSYAKFGTNENLIKPDTKFGPFRGGLMNVADYALKAGFNLLDSINPLYINVGITFGAISHHSRGFPYSMLLVDVGEFLQIEGKVGLNSKLSLTYDFTLQALQTQGTVISTGDLVQEQATLDSTSSNGFGIGISGGLSYKLGARTSFFAKLHAKYKNLPATHSNTMQTIVNTATGAIDSGIVSNQTFSVSYPKSHTAYIGLNFGFEF